MQSSGSFDKNSYKAILQNMKNDKQGVVSPQDKEQLIQIMKSYDDNPKETINKLMNNPNIKQIFQNQIIEYYSWVKSFKHLVKEEKKQSLKSVNIEEQLAGIQHKLNLKNSHSGYLMWLTSVGKKNGLWDRQFMEKWNNQTKVEAKKTMQLIQQKIKSNQQNEQQALAKKIIENQKAEPINQQVKEVKESEAEKQRKRKQQQKLKMKIKEIYLKKSQANKKIRLKNIINYLDTRREFTYAPNKQAIAQELSVKLEKFMSEKIGQIIHAAKLRHSGFDNEAGDEFKVYCNSSLDFEQEKFVEKLPKGDYQYLKVKYPSKMETYLRLKIAEEQKQEYFKNEAQKILETDKKENKFLQIYALADQDQKEKKTEFEYDEGPNKSVRLKIQYSTVQYVLESDPWFCDQYVIEKTFYREK